MEVPTVEPQEPDEQPVGMLWIGPDWARPGYERPMKEPDPEDIHDEDIYKTHPKNPSRSPAWRWLRAGMLQKRTVPKFRAWDDDLVRSALELRWRTASEDPVVCATAAAEWPDLHAAMGIFESNGPLRWELEARVLARESHLVIAAKIAQPVEVVDAFVSLFFDVESRLHCESFIYNHAIDSHRDSYDLGTCWRYFAYIRGHHSIDALVEVLHPVTGTAPEIDARMASRLTDEELACHLGFLGRHLTPSILTPRQSVAIDKLLCHFEVDFPGFNAPHPSAEELEQQLLASRPSLETLIAQTSAPARTTKKAV